MGIEAPPRALYIRTDAHRAVAHRDVLAVPRRDGPAGRRDHARVLRLPRPRVRPQPDRGRHRRALPPELQPHRRPEGRPAVGLDQPSAARRCARCSSRATSSRTSWSATRSSSSARARSASSRPSSAPRTACRARTCARAASTGTCAATASRTSPYDELDWKVWTHPDGDSFARYWVRLQETRESARMVLQLLEQMPSRPDHGEGAAHHQGARGRGLGQHREPARRDGLLHRVEGRDRARSA